MTFSYTAAGTIDQVRAQITAIKVYGDNPQAERVREFILSELDDAPAKTHGSVLPGLAVEASGHADHTTRYVSITMRQLWIPVDTEADPEA